ncbi:hypothetical protein KZ483_14430 [Paenibacillus sp. sptzw28]|uniref:hypothetical protein n=1 Tax=Paenibacillus sp. sptzw28 TaxID=715179 RepID=UPI001C6E1F68|nr:hypothetical protein [Paenibacillus sp. sptzw28]QYR19163.1 hypothetical protein KZ483_14430 [Paenibacillus sp. sptzw28]
MHIRRSWLLAGASTLILAALFGCTKSENSASQPPSAAVKEPPAEPVAIPAESKEELFLGGVSYYDGYDQMDSLEGGDTPASFKKDPSRPYGFYILETMKEVKLEEVTSWGTEDLQAELSLMDAGDVSIETNYINPALAKYNEYAGTHIDDETYNDYLVFTDHGRRLAIRLRYLKEELTTALPNLLASARSLRYVADPAAFKTGLEIEFPEGENEEEAEIYRQVKRNLEAIVAKDKSAFRDTLQTPDADYLDFFLKQEKQFRFTKLSSQISYPRDIKRADVEIEYEYLSDGIVHWANYTVYLLQDKEGRWYIANID